MPADANRSPHLSRGWSRDRPLTALWACWAALIVVLGVLGLGGGSGARNLVESWINIHVLFGLLLSGFGFARFQQGALHFAGEPATEACALSRRISRLLYLLLYTIIGVRQIVAIAGGLWHGSAVDFNPFDERFRHGPDGAGFDPKDDFQIFLACGVLALAMVRVLAFRSWLRSPVNAPKSKAGARASDGLQSFTPCAADRR